MTNWSSGYVSDIGYTYGYYQELNPLAIKLAFLNAGLIYPEVVTACELGFGQGISINIHSAASSTKWTGTDFIPAQASFAQELGEKFNSEAKLCDQSFSEFCCRDDLPDFDYIGLHGIWSWISNENRQIIVDFIRRKLKVGGVVYISYNTLPGWSSFAPMRQLMVEHATIMGSEGDGIVKKIENAIGFSNQFLATQPLYAVANSHVVESMKTLNEKDKNYLAHEYFNRDWCPMYFSDLNKFLEPAKVTYACSANYLEHIDAINLTSTQQLFINTIPDMNLRQSVRDFAVNQRFRRDYWVKGLRKLSPLERNQQISTHRIVLVSNRKDITLKVTGSLGEANLKEEIYNPILDILSDHQITTVGHIFEKLKGMPEVSFEHLVQAIMVLCGAGHIVSAQEEDLIKNTKKNTGKFNSYIINKSKSENDLCFLASPVTGGGIPNNRFENLFLSAFIQGGRSASDLANFAWNILQDCGQKILNDGKTLESEEENLTELTIRAKIFLDKKLPIIMALQGV